jgi:hypothetical protein
MKIELQERNFSGRSGTNFELIIRCDQMTRLIYLDDCLVTIILLCKLLNISVFQDKGFTLNGLPKNSFTQSWGAMECKSLEDNYTRGQ